jgi:DNA-binding transcriptional MocR family regulator
VTLPRYSSASALVQHASRHGVLLASGRQFSAVEADGSNIRLPFTADTVTLTEGLRRVVDAWRTFDHTPVPAEVI